MTTPSPIRAGILGGKGLLGGNLVRLLRPDFETVAVDLDNYDSFKGQAFDVLVNANGQSRRYWANQNPAEDFEASVSSVMRSLHDFKFRRYLYFSSSDAYPDHTTPQKTGEDVDQGQPSEPYGFHKRLAERLVERYAPYHFILRMSALLGRGLKKGPVYDILQDTPLFITLDSRIQFITAEAVAGAVRALLGRGVKNQIFNLGGKGSVSFREAERFFGRVPAVSPAAQTHVYETDVTKLNQVCPLKTSAEYLSDFLNDQQA